MDPNLTVEQQAYERRKSGIGIKMTLLYMVFYAGFVALSVFQPARMGARAVFGLNVASAYGLGLIVVAVALAIVYNQLCRIPATGNGSDKTSPTGSAPGGKGD